MTIDLANKIAVVMGSTAGNGFAIAKGLAAAGATVVVNGRTRAGVDAAVGALRQAVSAATIRGLAADLGTAAGCAALVAAEPSGDILVNNVGIFSPQDFFAIPDHEWTRFFETNVMSGVRLSRTYLPGMIERHWGRVVFLSSESALNIPADMIHYGFTKTAVLSIWRGLAKRVAGSGVTLAPGVCHHGRSATGRRRRGRHDRLTPVQRRWAESAAWNRNASLLRCGMTTSVATGSEAVYRTKMGCCTAQNALGKASMQA